MPGFDIQTVVEAGWSGVKNGELLRRADEMFDVFLTADRNLPYQQNLSTLRLGVVVLAIGSTKLDDLRLVVQAISAALHGIGPSEIILITPNH